MSSRNSKNSRIINYIGANHFWRTIITMHNTHYDKASMKLQIEKVHIRNKKVTKKWKSKVDVLGVGPTRLLKLHMAKRDTLTHFDIEQEIENMWLKRKINELEEALSHRPSFMHPLAIPNLELVPTVTLNTLNRIMNAIKPLNGIRT